jgi:exodeoxyribonuclease-3
MKEIKIISWNVNGLRAILNKGFLDNIKKLKPDILCLQEIKVHPEQLDDKIKELKYDFIFWNPANKKGYSGTALFSKIKPLNVKFNVDSEEDNKKLLVNEGRLIIAEFDTFYLLNVYVPNAKRDLSRLNLKTKEWWPTLIKYLNKLKEKKDIILCGDLNVAHTEIDLKNPQSNKTTKTKPGHAGFTDTERKDFDKLLDNGFVDVFRFKYPNKIQYTWWSYMFKAREKNVGWRIDYFIVNKEFLPKIIDTKILDNIFGSDHCPIELTIKK